MVLVIDVFSKEYQQISYCLRLGREFSLTFTGSPSATSWLEKLARIMGLVPSSGNNSPVVYCANTYRWRDGERSPVNLLNQFNAPHVPRIGWRPEDFGSVRLWYHQDIPDFLCELKSAKHYASEVQQMWYSMQGVYRALGERGGLPLHAALIKRDGAGVLLIAGTGIGKSTCCRRVEPPWNALADDLTVVIPAGDGTYFGHPMPTWSDHISGEWHKTWDVQRGVPLCGVFFLEQAEHDKAIPIGQGQAAIAITRSASYVLTRDWLKKDRSRERDARKVLFHNATLLAQSVPSFTLRASLTGSFRDEVDNALVPHYVLPFALTRNSLH